MPKHTVTSSSRRSIPKWLKVTIISVLVVANLALLGAIYAIWVGENALGTAASDDQVTAALDESTGGDLTILVVGSDSREGLDDLSNFGTIGGARADVVMLVKIHGDNSTTQMLSVPRDLWVDIPGRGNDKINAAYAYGGPTLMVETVKSNLGIEVNHYMEIGFVGFQGMIDELGGVTIDFPYPARDAKSGLDVDAGRQRLDGDMALAYARSRSYQELQNGQWVSVDANDIGRTARQREVIRAMMAEIKSPSTVVEAGSAASAMARHMTIDSRLAESSAARMAWNFRGIFGGATDGATLPTRTDNIGGASVEIMVEPGASTMLANFRSGQPLAGEALRLQVLNGNGIAGAAADMAARLEGEGFVVAAVGDADNSDYLQTTVIAPEGSDAGQRIVAALGFGVVERGFVDNGYDAVVIVGADAA
jgi:LCP family protein required for cell wall assembly